MTKLLYTSLVLFLSIFNAAAQNSGVATYKYVGENGKVNFFRLYFDAEKSLYVANQNSTKGKYNKINAPISIDDTVGVSQKQMGEELMSHSGILRIQSYTVDDEGNALFKNFKKDNLVERILSSSDTIILEEPRINVLQWTLIDSSKKIGKFVCQKATTKFRGREYEAWYTLEIPVSNGPWKLHGLPGLILEAQTKDKLFSYNFIGIESLKSDKLIIKPPVTGDKMSFFTFRKELDKRDDERVRKMMTQMSQRRTSITMSKTDDSDKYQELNYDDLK